MTDVAFVISNNRHHVAMLLPVIARLGRYPEVRSRVISLCEFRGQPSPVQECRHLGIEIERVVPFHLRRGAVARGVTASKKLPTRHRSLRALVWGGLLRPRLSRLIKPATDLVVIPNDAAYPYDHLTRILIERGVAFLLVQEGIRFPLPGVATDLAYGSRGAAAVAAWGESSVGYFLDVGVASDRIHVTGNPRFDADQLPVSSSTAGLETGAPRRELLLVTNPIDEQGFCTNDEKLALVRRCVDGIESLIEDGTVRLTLKLHGSESVREYQSALCGSKVSDRILFAEREAVFPLLANADAAIVMASTVGLEALLFGVPVGVLELPGTGFVFDYVKEGAALGLTWSEPMAPQVRRLLDYHPPGGSRFLNRHLFQSPTETATAAVTGLILDLCQHPREAARREHE